MLPDAAKRCTSRRELSMIQSDHIMFSHLHIDACREADPFVDVHVVYLCTSSGMPWTAVLAAARAGFALSPRDGSEGRSGHVSLGPHASLWHAPLAPSTRR